MKQMAFLPVFASALKVRPTCDSPPELISGAVWNCNDEAGQSVSAPFNHSDSCHIHGAGCHGYKVCFKGNWKGKPKCPKNCESTPPQPSYGGLWSCSGHDHSTCSFTEDQDFTCKGRVVCNTIKGKWRGRTKCKYVGAARPQPDPRPNGDYDCRTNSKCIFTCDDGTYAGKMHYKNGFYTSETSWYQCCPAPSCQNGIGNWIGDQTGTDSTCPSSACVQCESGYELSGDFCISTATNLCVCENGSPPSRCSQPYGSEICDSCDSGYELLQEACVLSDIKEFCDKADPLDIVYVVDGSSSVNQVQFMQELNLIRGVSAAMDIGPTSTRIAFVQYSHSFNVEFNFIDDPSKVVSAFSKITYQFGGTNTGAAIAFAYDNVVQSHARAGIQVKIVVVTDGWSYDDVRIASDEMRARGIEMVAVGFAGYRLSQLQDIANNPDQEYLYTGNNGDDLKDLIEDVTKTVCKTDGTSLTRSTGGFTPLDENVLTMIENSYTKGPENVDD